MNEVRKQEDREAEYKLFDFWMTSQEWPSMGPFTKNVYEILSLLDSSGKGESLTRAAAEDIDGCRKMGLRTPEAEKLHDIRVGCVRYISANNAGPQEFASFSWEEFLRLERPKFLKGSFTTQKTYSAIERISPKYRAAIRP